MEYKNSKKWIPIEKAKGGLTHAPEQLWLSNDYFLLEVNNKYKNIKFKKKWIWKFAGWSLSLP